MARLLAPSGAQNVPVGTPVALLVEEASDIAAFANWSPASTSSTPETTPSTTTSQAHSPAPTPTQQQAPPRPRQKVSDRLGPAARMLLQAAGLQAYDIPPSGPKSIVTKGDVLAALRINPVGASSEPTPPSPDSAVKMFQSVPAPAPAQSASSATAGATKTSTPTPAVAPRAPATQPPGAQAPAPFVPRAAVPLVPGGTYVDAPNSQIRRVIASRLLESKVTIPALYITATAPLDAVQTMRTELASQGIKVSVNDCVLKAIALALTAVPGANAFWDEASGSAIQFADVDISVAVATERGLITPIVKSAAKRSLTDISLDVKSLAGRARDNKLRPDEFIGGSFTVSNLGMFGMSEFSAIINPPQVCLDACQCDKKTYLLWASPAVYFYNTTLMSDCLVLM